MPNALTLTKSAVDALKPHLQSLKDAREKLIADLDPEAMARGVYPESFTNDQVRCFNELDAAIALVESKLRFLRASATSC